jgi:hypothetical protein
MSIVFKLALPLCIGCIVMENDGAKAPARKGDLVLDLLVRVIAVCCLCSAMRAWGAEADNAKTAGQIGTQREHACTDLKGAAREQCLNGYVGPDRSERYGRDSVYTTRHSGSKPKSVKGPSEWTRPGRY